MNSVAPVSQQFVKEARLELEQRRRQLIDQAYRAHKKGQSEASSKLFDSVLELDSQLAQATDDTGLVA